MKPYNVGAKRGRAVGTIYSQVTSFLIEFVLHPIERRELDIGINESWGIGPYIETMPWVGTPLEKRSGKAHRVFSLW